MPSKKKKVALHSNAVTVIAVNMLLVVLYNRHKYDTSLNCNIFSKNYSLHIYCKDQLHLYIKIYNFHSCILHIFVLIAHFSFPTPEDLVNQQEGTKQMGF